MKSTITFQCLFVTHSARNFSSCAFPCKNVMFCTFSLFVLVVTYTFQAVFFSNSVKACPIEPVPPKIKIFIIHLPIIFLIASIPFFPIAFFIAAFAALDSSTIMDPIKFKAASSFSEFTTISTTSVLSCFSLLTIFGKQSKY